MLQIIDILVNPGGIIALQLMSERNNERQNESIEQQKCDGENPNQVAERANQVSEKENKYEQHDIWENVRAQENKNEEEKSARP